MASIRVDLVNGTTLKTSMKTQVSGNAQTKLTTMALTGTLSQLLAQNATATTNDSVAIDDFGKVGERFWYDQRQS